MLFCFVLAAQHTPKLGLTLSGGGAKGLAHIGVLQVLEENGIVPDYLTGTSMGSIIGGLYAIGYTAAELDTLARTLEWDNYFNDSYPRTFLPIEDRARADRYQLSFALEDGKLSIPRGLIGGKKILTLLTGLSAPCHTHENFDEFCIPFRCVATDLETGEPYVFDKGPLRMGIRASMSIPSAFEPLEYDGRLLVDGLLVRNLPVTEALEMGADKVIAVDVGDPLYPREELQSVLRVLEQTASFGMAMANEEQRALAHFIIDPDLSGYSTLSYDAADSLIARGRTAALAALPALLDSLARWGIPTRALPQCPPWRRDSFLVKELIFKADSPAARKTLAQLVRIKTPGIVTIRELENWVGTLYGSGFFSSVDFQFNYADGGHYVLEWIAKGSPDYYLRGSINYDIDYSAGLLLNLTARNRLINGSILTLDGRISEYPGLWVDYTVYTRSNPSLGFRLFGGGQSLPGQIYEVGELIDEFAFHNYRFGADVSTSISRQWYFKLGAMQERFSANPRFFSLEQQGAEVNQSWAYGSLIRDTYDRLYFPTDGSFTEAWVQYNLNGELRDSKSPTGRLDNSGVINAGLRLNKAFRLVSRWWVDWSVGGGAFFSARDHLLNRFYLGRAAPAQERFFEVYGLAQTELSVSRFAYTRVQIRTELGRNNFVGIGYNFGGYQLVRQERVRREDDFQGIGLELGTITPLGPLRFTTEYNIDYQRFNFTFRAGYRF